MGFNPRLCKNLIMPPPDVTREPQADLPSPRTGWRIWVMRTAAVVLTVLVLAGLGLRFWVWPRVAEKLNDTQALQQLVDQALVDRGLQRPFEFQMSGARGAFINWWTPGITIDQVRLTQSGRTLLAMDQLQAHLGLRSLLAVFTGEPVFSKLTLERVQLDLQREANGRLRLLGLPIEPGGAAGLPPNLVDWLTQQGPLSLGQLQVQWQDQASGQQGELAATTVGARFGRLGNQLTIGRIALGPVAQWLATSRPELQGLTGEWTRVSAELDAPLTRLSEGVLDWSVLSDLQLAGEVQQLGLPQMGPLRRLQGLSGRIQWRGDRLVFDLDSEAVALSMPTVFQSDEFQFDRLQLRGELALAPDPKAFDQAWRLEVGQASLQNQDLRLDFKGRYEQVKAGERRVAVSGSIGGLNPQRVATYLPTEVGQDARAWVRTALGTGRLVSGDFTLQGDPSQFPFAEDQPGEFRVRLKVEDQQLAFAPDWPKMQGIFAEVVFDRASLQVTSRQARLANTPIAEVTARIEDLLADDPVLTLQGQFQTGLQSMLETVNASPVRDLLAGLTEGAVAKGSATLGLSLSIPLNDTDRTKVQGELKLQGNELLLTGGIPPFRQLSGGLRFSEEGLESLGLQAEALGGPVSLAHQPMPDRRQTRLTAKGQLSGPGLSAWMAQSLGVSLKDVLVGRTDYQVDLSARRQEVRLTTTSDLRGLSIQLPDPLAKRAEDRWPLQLSMTQQPEAGPSRARTSQRQTWRLSTDQQRLAVVAEQLIRAGQVEQARGLMRIGSAATGRPSEELPKTQGLVVRLGAPKVSLDQWLSALENRIQLAPAAESSAAKPGLALTRVEVKTPHMTIGEHALKGVEVQAAPQSGVWSIDLQSQASAGRILWQTDRRGRGKMIARLSRLWLTAPSEERQTPETEREIERSLTSISEARRWPSIDLVAEDFRRGEKRFGRLALDASPDPSADRWIISSLEVSSPDAVFKANGSWEAVKGGPSRASETRLAVQLSINSSEGLLSRLGYAGLLRATPGELRGELRWRGSPTDFRVQTMAGQIGLDLKSGQFLKAEPGLSKLISVVNLQSLPKRISLDFRDIFSQGFAYERVRGDVAFGNGQAVTTNLRIVGVQASVFIDGQADLLAETQNTRVLVLPELNAGLASLGYALVNPAIGLGSFLAQYVLRDPLRKILAYEYQLSGPWADPMVKEVSRRDASRELEADRGVEASGSKAAGQ